MKKSADDDVKRAAAIVKEKRDYDYGIVGNDKDNDKNSSDNSSIKDIVLQRGNHLVSFV